MEGNVSEFPLLKKEDLFENYDDFAALRTNLEETYGLTYNRRSSKKIANDTKLNHKPFNPAIVYSELFLQCEGSAIVNGKNVQCPSKIKLYSKANTHLRIHTFDMKHNHLVSQSQTISKETLERCQKIQILVSRLTAMLLSSSEQEYENLYATITQMTGTSADSQLVVSHTSNEEIHPSNHVEVQMEEEEESAQIDREKEDEPQQSSSRDGAKTNGNRDDHSNDSSSTETVRNNSENNDGSRNLVDTHDLGDDENSEIPNQVRAEEARYGLRRPKAKKPEQQMSTKPSSKPTQARQTKVQAVEKPVRSKKGQQRKEKVVFGSLLPRQKLEQVLDWLNVDVYATKRIALGEYKLKDTDFESNNISYSLKELDGIIPDWIEDILVDATEIGAREKIIDAVKSLPDDWDCLLCKSPINQKIKGVAQKTIQCQSCLILYHQKCCGITRAPKIWFCEMC